MYITTTAPISLELLKSHFESPEKTFLIDYANSKLKGLPFLVYMSNLDLPFELHVAEDDEVSARELFEAYLNTPSLLSCRYLEELVLYVILVKLGAIKDPPAWVSEVMDKHSEMLAWWISVLSSLRLYALYALTNENLQQSLEQLYPVSLDSGPKGINFVNLIKHPYLEEVFERCPREEMILYKTLFTEAMYKGKSLFHYWLDEDNSFAQTMLIGLLPEDEYQSLLQTLPAPEETV